MAALVSSSSTSGGRSSTVYDSEINPRDKEKILAKYNEGFNKEQQVYAKINEYNE